MKKIFFLLAVVLAGSTPIWAQQADQARTDSTSRSAGSAKRYPILKFTPLALFDPDNTFQAGIELPFGTRFSFQQEAGYGHSAFNVFPSERDEYPNRETWRFRTQLRRYYRITDNGGGYFAAEYLFKKNSISQYKPVGRDCSSPGQCAYFEYRSVSLGRFVNALHLKIGWQYYLSPRMNLDVYFGMGLRSLTVRDLGQSDQEIRDMPRGSWIRSDQPGRYDTIGSLNLGFHLGWILGPVQVR